MKKKTKSNILNSHANIIQQDAEKYIRNSIRAYLEGTRSEKWLLGVAGVVNIDALTKAIEYRNHSPRLNFLRQAFNV